MNLDKKYIKIFPQHQDVFTGDIEEYKKHFLSICSLNLMAIDPQRDQWLHFVVPKETFEGCVAEQTHDFHTDFCKEDMIGFNVVGQKYEFEANWNYFIVNQQSEQVQHINEESVEAFGNILPQLENKEMLEQWLSSLKGSVPQELERLFRSKYNFLKNSTDPDLVQQSLDDMMEQALEADLSNLAGAYELNQQTYELVKQYYNKHGQIYPFAPGDYSYKVPTLFELEQRVAEGVEKEDFPEFFGILSDIKFESKEQQGFMKEFGVELEQMQSFDQTNLMELPYDSDGHVFEYIGKLTGYLFQYYGADGAYLFYSQQHNKAVICLEHS